MTVNKLIDTKDYCGKKGSSLRRVFALIQIFYKPVLSLSIFEGSMTKQQIEFADFSKVDIRVGTILEAMVNDRAKQPAFILRVDFGVLGIKTASAQITEAYTLEELPGVQVVAVVNFPPKRVAGIKSEVLILAVVQEDGPTILLQPNQPVANGSIIA